MINTRTADELRPRSFDDIVGQEHLFGERGVIRRMLAGGRITNMIFYGPPGTHYQYDLLRPSRHG